MPFTFRTGEQDKGEPAGGSGDAARAAHSSRRTISLTRCSLKGDTSPSLQRTPIWLREGNTTVSRASVQNVAPPAE